MAAYNKFQQFVGDVMTKVHDLASDALKVMLANVAPVATNSVLADLTEITAGNGYTAGGNPVTVTTAGQSGGTFTLAGDQVVFTAAGGPIGPLRYAALYNSTPTTPLKPLIAWWDYGASITLNDGETLTVKFNSASPGTIHTLA